jgi:hypothetical protein
MENRNQIEVGSRDNYQWLVSKHTLGELLECCPEIPIGKYIAVTSLDSGPLQLSDVQKAAGWTSSNGIAYSPRIGSIELLPPHDGYDEWYVFATPTNLGELVPPDRNIFESVIRGGHLHVFVNFGSYAIGGDEDLSNLFWEQIKWIQPESYIADGDRLNFATSRKDLFSTVERAIRKV